MGKKPLFIFGVRYAGPKGLRRSPKTNWLASCVAREMAGKKFGNRAATRAGFSRAANACSGSRGRQ